MVELLAPAGNKDCLAAALDAGADAVYIGGEKFGARAYAENFSGEEILQAIDEVHLRQKKLYLTVNTLVKESELSQLIPYLIPFYEAGLDGVIVQDFGALILMRREFPQMEMHASTQMTVTGSLGASLLKEAGICRIVPARELSLKEIRQIKKDTGLSIETFIHGAMCYAYSGQCLFSSMLGQRSGNRGRCAGPCRLPYQAFCDGKQMNDASSLYQLSLKDLCSLDILPQLIGAGIDSFKIEGRMKSKEYVSCVTGMYRHYIDAYYADPKGYRVNEADKQMLLQNFCRGSLETGYYFMHNGRKLVTLQKPGYQSFATETAGTRTKGVERQMTAQAYGPEKEADCRTDKIPLTAYFSALSGREIALTMLTQEGASVTVTGAVAQEAVSKPADHAQIQKALSKTGNTPYIIRNIEVETDGNVFLSHKMLNELRRDALEQLGKQLLSSYKRVYEPAAPYRRELPADSQAISALRCNDAADVVIWLRVETLQQFLQLSPRKSIRRIYLSYDCLTEAPGQYVKEQTDFLGKCAVWKEQGTELFLALPAICRQSVIRRLQDNWKQIASLNFDGFLVNNLESLQLIRAQAPDAKVVSDSRFYLMNSAAARFFEAYGVTEHILSFELHEKEIIQLVDTCRQTLPEQHLFYLPVYGYIPVMESAGCILQTNGACRKGQDAEVILQDRQNKSLRVVRHCDRCENTIYHTYPLSLHREMARIGLIGTNGILLSFTGETPREMNRLTEWYEALLGAYGDSAQMAERLAEIPFRDFTKGHFAKGVE